MPLSLAILFVFSGFYLGYYYVGLKKDNIEQKKQMLALNNKYANYPKVFVDACDIELEHKKNQISATALLKIINQSNKDIDTLIFSLNPSLQINDNRDK